jgi:hypothetical protein
VIGEPLRGHQGFVNCVSFSPDGKTLASGSGDSTIRLWDAETGRTIGDPLRGHEGSVECVAFSPDGKTLASKDRGSGGNASFRLWDTATGRPLGDPLRGHEGSILGENFGVAFSPDGKALASWSADNFIRQWNAVPLRDRIGDIRARLAMVDEVRIMLAPQLATLGTDGATVTALQESVLTDPRFTGDLRTAALIVIGELDLARQAEAERLLAEINEAVLQNDWSLVLRRLTTIAPTYTWMDAVFWNDVAWAGLTELPAGAPGRDLNQLLIYAERAVKLLRNGQGYVLPNMDGTVGELGNALDTLARAHWELGDKTKAIDVQREAVTESAAALGTKPDDQAKAMHAEIEATLKLYESLPAGAALPKEATPDTSAPTPNP